jgi:predicted dehydrogenase
VGTFAEAARLITGGALGKVSHALAESYGPVVLRRTKPTWRGKAGQGGGCLHDYAAHPINLLNWAFGAPEHCLGASLTRHFSAEVADQTHALLQFPDGVVGQVSVDWSDPSVRKMTTKLSFWGEAGKLCRHELQLFLTGKHSFHRLREGWTVSNIKTAEPVSSTCAEKNIARSWRRSGARSPRRSHSATISLRLATDLTIGMMKNEQHQCRAEGSAAQSGSAPRSFSSSAR